MTLNDSGHLAIAELVFWAPAFFLSALLAFRHGLSHSNPWLFLSLLGICRVVSGACTIAFEEQTVPSIGLIEAAAITSSLGISFLLIGLAGLQSRISANMSGVPLPRPLGFGTFYLVTIVGLVLSIVGVVDISGSITAPAKNGNDAHLGYSLFKAATILFLFVVVALAVLVAYTLTNMSRVQAHERTLVIAVLISLPFVFVRVLYAILLGYVNSKSFNIFTPDIWVKSFMQIFEEMVVALVLIVAGFMAERPREKVDTQYSSY